MPKVQTARGDSAPFEFSGTTTQLFDEDFADIGITGEVKIFGEVVDTGNSFLIRARMEWNKTFACDRCLVQTTGVQSHQFEEELEKTDVTDDLLDVTELFRDELLAGQPMKNLCKADCKGLCPVCGANLNDGDCGCDRLIVDPRLAALENFR
ncbi:MAG: DUF177 domain-containing protein [Selenomonadaceae bacterium]|nr:DUF177 domain-containing protein [Selenomonadaceae bacterium]